MSDLSDYKGNIFCYREKEYRLKELKKEIENKEIDEEFIPYLNKINEIPLFVTTQCCTGHNENPRSGGRKAHIDFRSALSPDKTINYLLRPLENIVNISLMLEEDRCRYVLWLDNDSWRTQIEKIIDQMYKVCNKNFTLEMKKLKIGDIVKLNNELLEIVNIIPHQDIEGAVYYKFSNEMEIRDIRLHPDNIYLSDLGREECIDSINIGPNALGKYVNNLSNAAIFSKLENSIPEISTIIDSLENLNKNLNSIRVTCQKGIKES